MIRSQDFGTIEMSADRFPRTIAVIEGAVSSVAGEGVTPGAVAGFWTPSSPGRCYILARGHRRLLPTPLPMEKETIIDVASLTKVMGTAALAAALVDRGWLSWDVPVTAILAGYSSPSVRLHHLLSHTAGLPALFPYWERLREKYAGRALHQVPVRTRQRDARDMTLGVSLEASPGERALYSDVSYLLAGYLLEEVSGMPLDRAVRKLVWEPMGLRGPYFHHVKRAPDQDRNEKVAATEDSEWRGGILQGQVHDDNCWAMGGYGGHAGVFASLKEVLFFGRAILTGHFSPATSAAMWTRVSEPSGCGRTLGWDTPSAEGSSAGRYFSAGSIGHLGYTGTALWLDPKVPIAAALLTNRVHPSRSNERIRQLRPAFFDALREDLAATT